MAQTRQSIRIHKIGILSLIGGATGKYKEGWRSWWRRSRRDNLFGVVEISQGEEFENGYLVFI